MVPQSARAPGRAPIMALSQNQYSSRDRMKHAHHHHHERRARLIAEMRARSGGGIDAIPTAPEALRNADTPYPYRPDSHFYYLPGFPEPEAVAIPIAGTAPGEPG